MFVLDVANVIPADSSEAGVTSFLAFFNNWQLVFWQNILIRLFILSYNSNLNSGGCKT